MPGTPQLDKCGEWDYSSREVERCSTLGCLPGMVLGMPAGRRPSGRPGLAQTKGSASMSKSVQAVERACDLLFLIASSPAGLGVTEIATRLGLSKSAVHRLLVALSNKSMIRQESRTQQYRLDAKVLELVLPFRSQNDILAIARPFLEDLRDRYQETAVLALREGFSCRLVAHAASPHELRYSPTIGRVMPLHWGAFGKAILASLPAVELEAFFRDTEMSPVTERT